MWYILIIIIAYLVTSLIGFNVLNISVGTSFLVSAITILLLVAIDAVIAIVVRWFPQKCYDPYKKYFIPLKGEKKFYNAIKINKWKDYIPESGKYLVKFGKRKVENKDDPKYLYKFLTELGYAEVMHTISAPASFLVIAIMPIKYWAVFTLPCAIINFIFQLLPVFIQRYNRARLLKLYERVLAKQKKLEDVKDDIEQSFETEGNDVALEDVKVGYTNLDLDEDEEILENASN